MDLPDDGNSLFASVSVSLWATPERASELRQAAVQFVVKNWTYFGQHMLLPGLARRATSSEYAQHMSRDGAYAAEPEVQALASILHATVTVYTPDGKRAFGPLGTPRRAICLKLFPPAGRGHYELMADPAPPQRPAPARPAPAGRRHLEATSAPSSDKLEGTLPAAKSTVQTAAPAARAPPGPCEAGCTQASQRRLHGCFVVAPERAPPLRLSSRFAALQDDVQDPDESSLDEASPCPSPPPSVSARSTASSRRRRRRKLRAARQATAPLEISTASVPRRQQVETDIELPFGKVKALVDSGSSYSLVDARLVAASHVQKRVRIPRLHAATGAALRIAGAYPATVRWDGREHVHEFLVCNGLNRDAILGLDWLHRVGAVLDFRRDKGILTCGGLPEAGVPRGSPAAISVPAPPPSRPFPPPPPPRSPRAAAVWQPARRINAPPRAPAPMRPSDPAPMAEPCRQRVAIAQCIGTAV